MWLANLTSFVPVLVLITRVIHRSKLHFAVARNIVYKSNSREKTWQVESVEYIEQYHIKCVESSPYLKRRGRKAFVEWFFCCHNLHHRVTVSCTLSPISFFASDKFFQFSFKLKRIISTLLLCNKRYRSPCSFKSKRTFISLSSLAWRKFVRARANLRALMTQKSCAVGMRNAILRNHLKLSLWYK